MSGGYRVAMVGAMPYPTGQGTQALVGELAGGLAARGHQIHLTCYHHRAFDRPERFAIHRIPGIPFYRRLRSGPDLVRPLLDGLLAATTARIVRRFGCQLIHAHNYEGALAGWLAARHCRVPLVYHAHNLMEDELPSYFEGRFSAAAARLTGAVLDRTVPRMADRVITIHDRLAGALSNLGVPAARIDVVPPGIDTDFWGSVSRRRNGQPTIIYTGNLDRYQDLWVLFRAMPGITAKIPDARLVIATPNDTQQARQLADHHGAGRMTSVVHTPNALATRQALHQAAVAVCPRSSWSGFPIKNLNAQAAGLPVVACRGSAHGPELTVPDRDPAALAEALVSLLKDASLIRSSGEAARAVVKREFSLERMLTGTEDCWDALLAGR